MLDPHEAIVILAETIPVGIRIITARKTTAVAEMIIGVDHQVKTAIQEEQMLHAQATAVAEVVVDVVLLAADLLPSQMSLLHPDPTAEVGAVVAVAVTHQRLVRSTARIYLLLPVQEEAQVVAAAHLKGEQEEVEAESFVHVTRGQIVDEEANRVLPKVLLLLEDPATHKYI